MGDALVDGLSDAGSTPARSTQTDYDELCICYCYIQSYVLSGTYLKQFLCESTLKKSSPELLRNIEKYCKYLYYTL